MKRMKRFASFLLAVMMVLIMAVPTFAEETGTITVSNAVPGQTYTIYRIFDLESYTTGSSEGGMVVGASYAYKVNNTWKDFVTTGAGKDYVSVDAQGYVSWKTDAKAADFAKLALAYAQENSITSQGSSSAPAAAEGQTTSTLTFEHCALGYYLLDSSVGALCSLDTTNPNITVQDKNGQPTINKQVQEDSDNQWKKENDASIGQTVNFRSSVKVRAGAQNYVVHDQMSEGMTLVEETVSEGVTQPKIEIKRIRDGGEMVVDGDNYTVNTSPSDGCTFEISFTESFCSSLAANDEIVITYSAVLNEKAVTGTAGNKNTTWLTYGDNNTTVSSTTTTYTYEFDLVKTNENKKILTGATFKLYDASTGGNEILVVKEADNEYRLAKVGETGVEIEAGNVVIKGVDNGTYYLEETAAPAGYNKLSGRTGITISGANNKASLDSSGLYNSGGLNVINQIGNELPSTGGMGTRLLYAAGAVLVIAAGVLLITRKRMSNKEEEQ